MSKELPDDGPLVRSALEGDQHSLATLVERLMVVPRMLRGINRRRGSPLEDHDIEDLSQDVLILVWRKLQRFGDFGTLDPWLYRFCQLEFMNRYRTIQRRSRRMQRLAQESRDEAERQAAAVVAQERNADPEHVECALAELSPKEAEVLRLRHEEGMTFPAMGEHLGESPEAVKARYYRSMQELRRRLLPRRDTDSNGGSSS